MELYDTVERESRKEPKEQMKSIINNLKKNLNLTNSQMDLLFRYLRYGACTHPYLYPIYLITLLTNYPLTNYPLTNHPLTNLRMLSYKFL